MISSVLASRNKLFATFTKEDVVPDQPSGKGFDPQQSSSSGQQGQSQQQNGGEEDEELSQFLQQHHGHTKQAADAEVKRDREGVKQKKKQHDQQHGSSTGRGR